MSAAHGLRGPRHLALNHVVQVSTLRGRACMNVAGCILANEQLVDFSLRQTGQTTAQGVQKFNLGHLSTPRTWRALIMNAASKTHPTMKPAPKTR